MEGFPFDKDLSGSIIALHRKLDGQHELLVKLMEVQTRHDKANQFCFPPGSGREQKLLEAIHETIMVLEESRKSFRSKQLECLRKRLLQLLLEAEDG